MSLGKFIVILICVILLITVFYWSAYKWSYMRDIKRYQDLQQIVHLLDYYYSQFGEYPSVVEDDFNGWDISSQGDGFLESILQLSDIKNIPSDPINDDIYYYAYKKFPPQELGGCEQPFYVLQVSRFETQIEEHGDANCSLIDWTKLAPYGYSFIGVEK